MCFSKKILKTCVECGESRMVRRDSNPKRCASCSTKKQHRDTNFTVTHGHSPRKGVSLTYLSWHNMISRCKDKNPKVSKNYSHVEVCEDWSWFYRFLNDMGEKPKGYEIHRKDNTKGYYKENCEWVSNSQHKQMHVLIRNGAGYNKK